MNTCLVASVYTFAMSICGISSESPVAAQIKQADSTTWSVPPRGRLHQPHSYRPGRGSLRRCRSQRRWRRSHSHLITIISPTKYNCANINQPWTHLCSEYLLLSADLSCRQSPRLYTGHKSSKSRRTPRCKVTSAVLACAVFQVHTERILSVGESHFNKLNQKPCRFFILKT
jgi:hypothetical protein